MIMTSHSSRGTFKSCKRKYHWSYIKGLQQDRKPKALRMGSAWSDGLEYGEDAIVDFYGDLLMSHKTPEWELGDLEHEMLVLKALYVTYPFAIGEEREVGFRHVDENYEDRGQLDGLKITDKGMRRVIIVENKLYARFGKQEIEKLEYDEQVTGYTAAVVDGECEGYEDVGASVSDIDIHYNVTMKPALRRKVNESNKSFTHRCVADIMGRPQHYHRQEVLHRTDEDLDDFRARRDKHVMDLMYEDKMGVWERSPSNCFDYGQCPFLKICRSPELEEIPEGYSKREERT